MKFDKLLRKCAWSLNVCADGVEMAFREKGVWSKSGPEKEFHRLKKQAVQLRLAAKAWQECKSKAAKNFA